jgi:hypothetical protein
MGLQQKWLGLSFEQKLSIIIAPLLIALVSGIAVPAINNALKKDPAPELRVIDLVVRNGNDREEKPSVEVTLHNRGDQRSIVKRVLFKIVDFAHLPTCFTAGALEASKQYEVLLPTQPKKDEVVEGNISQQLAPDEADRFVFRFDLPAEYIENEGEDLHNIYLLDVTLVHDDDASLHVGRSIVSAPVAPYPEATWLDDPRAAAEASGYDPQVISCYESNKAALQRMLALEGERSDVLKRAGAAVGVTAPSGSGSVQAASTTATSAPAASPTSGVPVSSAELAAEAKVSASSTAPDGIDAAGNPVKYSASNVMDGNPQTAWRARGDGRGVTLSLDMSGSGSVHLTEVGLLPGYAKVDPTNGVNRFYQNRRVTKVRWHFSDGTTIDQAFTDKAKIQRTAVDVTTSSVDIEIIATRPGDPEFNYTPISEVSLIGTS